MLSSNADTNGWLFVLAVYCLIAAIYSIFTVKRDLFRRGWTCLTAIKNNVHRMTFAFSLITVCIGLRAILIIPLRIYKSVPGIQSGEIFYITWLNILSDVISIGTVFGITLIGWDYAHAKFGFWSWLILFLVICGSYASGYLFTIALTF